MKGWAKGLDDAKREIKKLRDEYEEVRADPPGGRDELNKADSKRIQILEKLCGILDHWGEGIPLRWIAQNGRWIIQGMGGNDMKALVQTLRTRQDILKGEILKRKK